MEFTATLELNGKTATGFEVPADVLVALGPAKRPAVVVTINGYTYRTTVGVMGGRSLIPVAAEVRAAAGVSAGDTIAVTIVADTEPREVVVPDDVFAGNPAAAAALEKLSFTLRKEAVRNIESAKTPETRQRRIAKLLQQLSET